MIFLKTNAEIRVITGSQYIMKPIDIHIIRTITCRIVMTMSNMIMISIEKGDFLRDYSINMEYTGSGWLSMLTAIFCYG